MLLLSDTALVLGGTADDASSIHCQHMHPACVESNFALPVHPSNAQLYGSSAALAVGIIAANHWLAHALRDRHRWKYSPLFVEGPFIVQSAVDTWHNVGVSNRLSPSARNAMGYAWTNDSQNADRFIRLRFIDTINNPAISANASDATIQAASIHLLRRRVLLAVPRE
ncbi:MAG TPA: hypothetical protein VMP68_18275 [Candidatus Eisenbacteria bacterium]|nr:hypothetical protein [Candidatus Eisenbacteria bacterium]